MIARIALIIGIAGMVAACATGCATAMDTAVAVRGEASTALDSVRGDFLAWDQAHQRQILVNHAGDSSRVSYDADMTSYRTQRAPVVQGIKDAMSALTLLDTAIAVASSAKDGGLAAALATVWLRLGTLATAITQAGFNIPIPTILQQAIPSPSPPTSRASPRRHDRYLVALIHMEAHYGH